MLNLINCAVVARNNTQINAYHPSKLKLVLGNRTIFLLDIALQLESDPTYKNGKLLLFHSSPFADKLLRGYGSS